MGKLIKFPVRPTKKEPEEASKGANEKKDPVEVADNFHKELNGETKVAPSKLGTFENEEDLQWCLEDALNRAYSLTTFSPVIVCGELVGWESLTELSEGLRLHLTALRELEYFGRNITTNPGVIEDAYAAYLETSEPLELLPEEEELHNLLKRLLGTDAYIRIERDIMDERGFSCVRYDFFKASEGSNCRLSAILVEGGHNTRYLLNTGGTPWVYEEVTFDLFKSKAHQIFGLGDN